MSGLKPTRDHVYVLQSLADQPDGSCQVNWLPTDIDFSAYRECREHGLLSEKEGRAGFTIAAITDAGRSLLREQEQER